MGRDPDPMSPMTAPLSRAPLWRRLLAAALAIVAIVAVAAAARDDGGREAGGTALGVGLAGEAPGTTTTVAPSGVGLPDLPVPGPLPLNAHEATPQVVLGRVDIPKLEVSQELQQGMTLTAINRGPSHWPGTPLPGEMGNVVVAGHRVTYLRSFNRLDELVAGDQVVFTMLDGGVHTYEVVTISIVGPEDLWIADQTYAHTATLFACHPKHSARQRIVASLRLLGPDGRPVDEVTPPLSDIRRDAWTDELFLLPPDHVLRPGEPPNLSAPGAAIQYPAAQTAAGAGLVPRDEAAPADGTAPPPPDPLGGAPG